MKANRLEEYIRKQVDELESNLVYEIATDSIRAWIDVFNEEEESEANKILQEIFDEHQEKGFTGLSKIIEEL